MTDEDAALDKGLLAEVLLPLALPGTLTYRVPAELSGEAAVGRCVVVPLGQRRATGYIVELRQGRPPPAMAGRLREVVAFAREVPALEPAFIRFLMEAARYYFTPPGEALHAAFPKAVRRSSTTPRRSVLRRRTDDPGTPRPVGEAQAPDPTPAQRQAIGRILEALDAGRYHGFLLHGVTASGKTEVYLRCAAEVLRAGRACLVLVPEIALTSRLVDRFRQRLGAAVAVVHSARTVRQRQEAWADLEAGRARVVIGARSALFAPVRDLALLVVDEEHDLSFKQAEGFRYNARDLALLRAREANAVVVLGSATPSLESFRNARTGKLELLELPQRATPRALAEVRVCDLRQRRRCHPKYPFFSLELVQEMEETLRRGEQAILFLNRRGFAPVAVCSGCGTFIACPSCSVALAYHKARNVLLCHYCAYCRSVPERCEACGRPDLDLRGLGTERIVAAVQELFPTARVGRLDSDVAPGRAGERVLQRLEARELDVLVGTQMVTKGHDFPGVTLVGIVQADLGLQLCDFRAAERTFQLLTQVAGRAGRGEEPGRVLLQTFLPDHYAIAAAAAQDYTAFLRAELPARRDLGYPPFGALVLVRAEGREEPRVVDALERLAEILRPVAEAAHVELLGPAPAPRPRLRGVYRHHLLVKGAKRKAVREVAAQAIGWIEHPPRGVRVILDVDPMHFV